MPGRGSRGRGKSERGGRVRRSGGRKTAGGRGKGNRAGSSKSSRGNGPPPVCKFFAQSRCNRGDDCRFRHEQIDGATTDKGAAYDASVDETHDGLWSYMGPNFMMVDLSANEFLQMQEEEWQDDKLNNPKLKREEEFVYLGLEAEQMMEIESFKMKGIIIASGVLRALVQGCCPSVVRITRLREEEMSELIERKKKGNAYFAAGEYAEAIESYDDALACICHHMFHIAPADQAAELANILSNQAECHLRLRDYEGAAQTATDALVLDCDHEKSRIRRAKAELSLYKDSRQGTGDFSYLVQARHDAKEVLGCPGASALASKTAHTLLEETDKLFAKEREKVADRAPDADFDMMVREVDSRCW